MDADCRRTDAQITSQYKCCRCFKSLPPQRPVATAAFFVVAIAAAAAAAVVVVVVVVVGSVVVIVFVVLVDDIVVDLIRAVCSCQGQDEREIRTAC